MENAEHAIFLWTFHSFAKQKSPGVEESMGGSVGGIGSTDSGLLPSQAQLACPARPTTVTSGDSGKEGVC